MLSSGSSSIGFIWVTVPTHLSPLRLSLTSFMDFSLPTVMGINVPGNTTAFRNTKRGSICGKPSLIISSAGSSISISIKGITVILSLSIRFILFILTNMQSIFVPDNATDKMTDNQINGTLMEKKKFFQEKMP